MLEDYEMQLAMALSLSMNDKSQSPASASAVQLQHPQQIGAISLKPSTSAFLSPTLNKNVSVMSFDESGKMQPSLLDVDLPAEFVAAISAATSPARKPGLLTVHEQTTPTTESSSNAAAKPPLMPAITTTTSPLRQQPTNLMDEDLPTEQEEQLQTVSPPMQPSSPVLDPARRTSSTDSTTEHGL
jgi:hypothetical protein